MKVASSNAIIRQGDVLLVPHAVLPEGASVDSTRVGVRIVGEGAHAHTLVGAVAVDAAGREYVLGGNVLQHEEHEHVATAERTWYEVRVQRAYVPQGNPVRGLD